MRSNFFVVILTLILVSTTAFPIGKTGNNRLFDQVDNLSVAIPTDYPFIFDNGPGSVVLKSPTRILIRSTFYGQASFQVFSFRDRYSDLTSKSLDDVQNYFLKSTETTYQIVSKSNERLVLIGENSSAVVGIILAPGGRGLVMVGFKNDFIKQGILDTMSGVVFQ